ncbi:MAG TPA: carboxypeptidase regulatory-like domain-containing protein [Terracidiphilus sp.]|nr:carboxypeptidase regulatory-like domain-containing protein [Terracidiphilus sp.]
MPVNRGTIFGTFSIFALLFATLVASAQSGNTGAVRGTVTDPSGAVIPGATVHMTNSVSGLDRTVTTDATGQFQLSNIPFNPYQISVSAAGFSPMSRKIEIHSSIGTTLTLVLQIAGASQTVTVESTGDLVEDDPTFHTDVDRDAFIKVPMESQSSSLSSLVTATTPGVSADSNGLFHGLGDHASNSFSVDGQSITDQQSKVFSNQLPSNSIQSIEVISGAPPAEYGDKTSLVIVATTRSGQGATKPTGSVTSSYGSFGSATAGFDLSYGGKNWGNFLEADGLNSGRFLDPPEFAVFHDKGNEENFFDRMDYTFTSADSLHLDMNYSRSWFQTPNSFENLNVSNVVSGGATDAPVFGNLGDTDQHSKIGTFNVSPTYTRVIGNNAVVNLGAFVRKDLYLYFPSEDHLADLGPANLQTSSIYQNRTLMNAAIHSDLTYSRGIQTIKAGVQYGQTFVRENDSLGIVDPTYSFSAPCVDASGNPVAGYANPSSCASGGQSPNPSYLSILAPYDFTRGGSYYTYFGHADVKELAMFVEDQIKAGNWNLNLGIRGDMYNGLTVARQAEPRLGVTYNVKPTATVLGISYARTLETPFNENLVLSSEGCQNAVLSPLLNCSSGVSNTMAPGFRNEFHVSIQQAFAKKVVVSGEYIWKYTHNAFDFSVLGNTPITFPIDWHNSKIPGYALHADVPQLHNFSAYVVMSSVAARFFPPQVAGAGATVGQTGLPFRIDHDEKFNQTTHLQYTLPGHKGIGGLWGGFNWRSDSGQVAGSVPCYNPLSNDPNSACAVTSTMLNGQPAVDLSALTADEEFQSGLICDGVKATPSSPLPAICPASEYSSSLVSIPAPGTGDNDKSPPRIQSRNLFDASLGKENVFHADHYKVDFDLTAINVTNKDSLYNFLSTFSGTHYVTPRALTAKVTFNF